MRGLVDGEGAQPIPVEHVTARAPSFRRAPEAVGLELAGGGALAVEVHRPEGEGGEEPVPSEVAQAVQLFLDRGESLGERGEVRDQHGVQLQISVEPHALQQVSHEVLVRVAFQPPPQVVEVEVGVGRRMEVERLAAGPSAVPHQPASPHV